MYKSTFVQINKHILALARVMSRVLSAEDGLWRAKSLAWSLGGAGLQLSVSGDRLGS